MHSGTSQDRTATRELIGFSRTSGKFDGTGWRSQGQRDSGAAGGGRAAVGRGLAARMALAVALLAGCDAEPGSLWRSPLGMEFAWIPAGKFEMGSPEGEAGRNGDERQHEVPLSQGFWMGRYEVTQGEWEAVMGSNPSYFHLCGSRCPVEFVSWDEVEAFIRSLNARESERGYRYRLPTEAEWEYAARAGSMGATPEGELRILGERNVPVLDGQAWYGGNSGVSHERGHPCSSWEEKQYPAESCGTHPVGQKRANGWGLHDMLGNVAEWTADWYGEYPRDPVRDPQGPCAGSARVIRGGSWFYHAVNVRSAARARSAPGLDGPNVGFRLLRTE